jgi:Leucine-rich repeat (LRR) protein
MFSENANRTRLERLEKIVENSLKEQCVSLRGESLTDSDLIDAVLPILAESDGSSKWTTLDLCWNNLTYIGIRELTKVLAKLAKKRRNSSVGLQNLHMDCNNLGDVGLKELCLDGGIASSLEVLTLGYNRISDQGAKELGMILPQSKLKVLSLECNSIADAGMQELGKGLAASSLKVLNLSYNRFTDEGLKGIAAALTKCPSLHELYLSSNCITNSGLTTLSQTILSGSSHLQKLDLSCNNFSDDGVKALVEAVKHSDLDSVDLSDNTFSLQLGKEMSHIIALKKSPWYKTMHALASVRDVPRLSRKSRLNMLPKELIREIGKTLPPYEAESHASPLIVLNVVVMFVNNNDEGEGPEQPAH